MPGWGITDAIFMLHQMQKKYLDKHKNLIFPFVNLLMAFARIPRNVLWWSMRKLGVEEWLVKTVHAIYEHSRSGIRVNGQYSEEFPVGVGVHQGSGLRPLLFVIVRNSFLRIYSKLPLGTTLCRWLSYRCQKTGWSWTEVTDMKEGARTQAPASEHGQDKNTLQLLWWQHENKNRNLTVWCMSKSTWNNFDLLQ